MHVFVDQSDTARDVDRGQLEALQEYETQLLQEGLVGRFSSQHEFATNVLSALEADVRAFQEHNDGPYLTGSSEQRGEEAPLAHPGIRTASLSKLRPDTRWAAVDGLLNRLAKFPPTSQVGTSYGKHLQLRFMLESQYDQSSATMGTQVFVYRTEDLLDSSALPIILHWREDADVSEFWHQVRRTAQNMHDYADVDMPTVRAFAQALVTPLPERPERPWRARSNAARSERGVRSTKSPANTENGKGQGARPALAIKSTASSTRLLAQVRA